MTEVAPAMYPGLQKLTEAVEDYWGYEEPAQRGPSDAAIRRCLIKRLETVRSALPETGSMRNHPQAEKLTVAARRKLHTLVDSLNRPTYLHTSFFNGRRITPRLLNRLYDLECGMLEDVELLHTEVQQLTEALELEQIQEIFLHIDNYIDDPNQQLFEREALIIGEY
ncbi:MAG: hypothetical protein ONA69_04100 [candidate division KSB1 bacterium]|nr:hypothetical protein [candidate division KSB1 bacterium]